MSNEIALHNGAHADMTIPAPVGISDPTGGRLVAWAEGLAAAHRIGSALCQTAFVPATFRGKPEEAAAAILYGDEIGFTPTQALQNIYVISGKPSMYARSMVALVLHHGHEVWTVEKTAAKVTVAGKRRGTSHIIEETWTTARAQKAGYTSNKKYSTDPEAMLYARAAADVCRQVAPDALAGLAYTVEELEVTEPAATTTVRRTAPKTTAQRAEVGPPPEPEFDAPTEAAPDAAQGLMETVTTTATAMTPRTRGQLFALFTELGISEDEQRAGIAHVLGRPIESRGAITDDEARRVIERLKVRKAEVEAGAQPVEPGVFKGEQ